MNLTNSSGRGSRGRCAGDGPRSATSLLTASPRDPGFRDDASQVRATNARGVTIHVGSVGFLHVSDVLVTFASGPIESVRVDDVLYTGQMVTLLTWLYKFVSKRL